MKAATFDIVEKRRERPFSLAELKDFRLRVRGQSAAEEILENPRARSARLRAAERLA